MSGRFRAPVDLLRERRIELGLPAQPAPFVPARLLVRQGALLGGAVILMCFAVTALVRWRGGQQRQQLESLASIEQRLTSSETQLQRLRTQTSALNQDSLKIAKQLVAFPGGSPLLEQLSRVTPAGVQLQELSVGETQINLLGRIQIEGPPGPLERINALMLSLEQLSITGEQGVKVMKVTREDGDSPFVTFSVEWALNTKTRLSLIELEDLGATGLAERSRLLQQRGVRL